MFSLIFSQLAHWGFVNTDMKSPERPKSQRTFSIYRVVAVIGYIIATAIMYFGVGTSFLPSSTRAEANEVWKYFFSAWLLGLVTLILTWVLIVKSRINTGVRDPRRARWTDFVVGAQALISVCYLLWGISARLQGR